MCDLTPCMHACMQRHQKRNLSVLWRLFIRYLPLLTGSYVGLGWPDPHRAVYTRGRDETGQSRDQGNITTDLANGHALQDVTLTP